MKFSDAPRHRISTETFLSITTLIIVGVICLTFQHINLKKKAAVKSAAVPVYRVVARDHSIPAQHINDALPTTQLMADEDIKSPPGEPELELHIEGNVSTVD